MNNRSQLLDVRSLVHSRMPATRTALTLLLGDLIALFGFVAVGQYKHGYLFWEYPTRTVLVLAPIICSWLVVGPIAGVASDTALRDYRGAILRIVPAWVVVAILSGLLRKTSLVPGYAPPSFFVVSVVFGLLFLGGWRVLARYVLT
jgi:hypothetical protein